jgi:hypothetical protein
MNIQKSVKIWKTNKKYLKNHNFALNYFIFRKRLILCNRFWAYRLKYNCILDMRSSRLFSAFFLFRPFCDKPSIFSFSGSLWWRPSSLGRRKFWTLIQGKNYFILFNVIKLLIFLPYFLYYSVCKQIQFNIQYQHRILLLLFHLQTSHAYSFY